MRDPTNPFAPLDNSGWMSMDERKNAASTIRALEAKLSEAVEVLHRVSLKSQDNSTTKEAVGREAFLFLATMEKPDGK
jgi:hypothetical protein